jgi:hypothetical protein
MSHLQPDVVHVVELHIALILSVDLLVTDQSSGGNSGLRHTITDEEDNVLGASLGFGSVNGPVGKSLLVVVVVQCQLVLSGFVQSEVSVCLGGNVDYRRCFGVLGKEVLQDVKRVSRILRIPKAALRLTSKYEKLHFSMGESSIWKNEVTSAEYPLPLSRVSLKFSSGTPLLYASVPLTGAWICSINNSAVPLAMTFVALTSSRMSKCPPAMNSA